MLMAKTREALRFKRGLAFLALHTFESCEFIRITKVNTVKYSKPLDDRKDGHARELICMLVHLRSCGSSL